MKQLGDSITELPLCFYHRFYLIVEVKRGSIFKRSLILDVIVILMQLFLSDAVPIHEEPVLFHVSVGLPVLRAKVKKVLRCSSQYS